MPLSPNSTPKVNQRSKHKHCIIDWMAISMNWGCHTSSTWSSTHFGSWIHSDKSPTHWPNFGDNSGLCSQQKHQRDGNGRHRISSCRRSYHSPTIGADGNVIIDAVVRDDREKGQERQPVGDARSRNQSMLLFPCSCKSIVEKKCERDSRSVIHLFSTLFAYLRKWTTTHTQPFFTTNTHASVSWCAPTRTSLVRQWHTLAQAIFDTKHPTHTLRYIY